VGYNRLDAFSSTNTRFQKIQVKLAMKLAEKEYQKFRVIQDENFESDFDKEVKKLKAKPGKK
jgi:hypothetical protein